MPKELICFIGWIMKVLFGWKVLLYLPKRKRYSVFDLLLKLLDDLRIFT